MVYADTSWLGSVMFYAVKSKHKSQMRTKSKLNTYFRAILPVQVVVYKNRIAEEKIMQNQSILYY